MKIPRWAPWAAAVAGFVTLVTRGRKARAATSGGGGRLAEPEPDDDPPVDGPPPKPIAVGLPSDPEIAALLEEMDAYFEDHGVDTQYASAREVTTMPKAPGRPSVIPPRPYWGQMAVTLRELVIPLRLEMGIPFELRGYRPPDYNEAVGGAPGSRHQWFEGVDIYLTGPKNTSANRRLLGLRGAQLYLQRGSELQIGFGAYGAPTPSDIHLDTGYDQRTWRDAQHYIALAQQVA